MQPSRKLPSSILPRPQLVSVEAFRKEAPVNMRWAIQKHYGEMVKAGALYSYGRKLLIDPDAFWAWLREKGRREASA